MSFDVLAPHYRWMELVCAGDLLQRCRMAHLARVPTARQIQNLAFAGPDKKTLYLVGRGAAWKVQTLTQGYLGRAK